MFPARRTAVKNVRDIIKKWMNEILLSQKIVQTFPHSCVFALSLLIQDPFRFYKWRDCPRPCHLLQLLHDEATEPALSVTDVFHLAGKNTVLRVSSQYQVIPKDIDSWFDAHSPLRLWFERFETHQKA